VAGAGAGTLVVSTFLSLQPNDMAAADAASNDNRALRIIS